MNRLGQFSLLLALVCLLITAGLKAAISGWIPFIGWGLGFGLFFLVFALLINLRYVAALLKSESLHFVLKSLGLVLVLLCLLGLINFVFYKKNIIYDLTKNKIHSLSPFSQELVSELSQPLGFYYFHVGNQKVRGFVPEVRKTLQPYLRLSNQLSLQVHSVFQRPDLAKKFKTGNEESSLFVEYGDRIERVSSLTEASITNALLKVTKEEKRIYFVEGHEERSLNSDATFGLKGIKEQLERLHYRISTLPGLLDLPQDVAILVLAGPREKLSTEEVNQLHQFLGQGGSLLLLADPGESHNLNMVTQRYGVELKPGFVFSKEAQAGQSELLVLTHGGDSTHELTQSLGAGVNPAFFMASPLSIDVNVQGVSVFPVLEYLPTSVTRQDVVVSSPIVAEGRQFAAALAEGTESSFFRLAVVGDSDFLTNQFYSQKGNFNLLLSLMTYLSKDEGLLKMSPAKAETTFLVMTQTQLNLYFLFFLIPFMAIFFIFALFFKLRRLF